MPGHADEAGSASPIEGDARITAIGSRGAQENHLTYEDHLTYEEGVIASFFAGEAADGRPNVPVTHPGQRDGSRAVSPPVGFATATLRLHRMAPAAGCRHRELSLFFRVERGVKAPARGCQAARKLVAWDGIEPPTRGFSVRCSTN